MTRPRNVCHHEAGHALALWFFGFPPAFVEVRKYEELISASKDGDQEFPAGVAFGDSPAFGVPRHEIPIEYAAFGRRLVEIELIVSVAGVVAEAAYTRRKMMKHFTKGGMGDWERVVERAREWELDEATIKISLARAKAILKSACGRAALRNLVELLHRRGRVEQVDIEKSCSTAFGCKTPFDPWRASWPPTLHQLRTGNPKQ